MSDITNQATVEAVNEMLAELRQAARDGALIENGYYATEAEGRAAVADGDTFKVAGIFGSDIACYVYRRISGSNSVLLAIYPSYQAIINLQSLIKPSPPSEVGGETYFLRGRDEEGGTFLEMTDKRTRDLVHEVRSTENRTLIGDEEGGVLVLAEDAGCIIGLLPMRYSSEPGIRVVDEEGGIFADLTDPGNEPAPSVPNILESGVYFPGPLAGIASVPVNIYVPSLLSDRLQAGTVTATISSTTTAASVTGNKLSVLTEDFGAEATMALRPLGSVQGRKGRALNIVTAPMQPAVVPAPKILLIGDSIGNRQGAYLLNQFLTAWGYTPSWIGTMRGSASPTSSVNGGGPLGECREGWETGHYTNALTDRSSPVAPGGEAAYLSMSKADQLGYNPFIRAATGGDDPSIVRNGYVLDFSFYQSRFGLSAPDVIIYALGTNDITRQSAAAIHDIVLGNDVLLLSRLRAAWPSAKILRTLPGTAINSAREQLWTSKYVPVIRAMADAITQLADPGISLVPAWALVDHDAGYTTSYANTDPQTGFADLTWADPLHPVGASRVGLYRALAPYAAAAALNLI